MSDDSQPQPESTASAPTWAKFLASLILAVVVSVIATIGWLDSRYATKGELALVSKDVGVITEIKVKLDKVDSTVTDLRVLLAGIKG